MLRLEPSTFGEFEQQCRLGDVVAVTRTIAADLLTPLGAYLRVAGGAPYSFLLESVQGSESLARYSFLGADPQAVLRSTRSGVELERDGRREAIEGSAFDHLRRWFGEHRLASPSHGSPFAGGAVGYIGYESSRWFEPALAEMEPQANDAVLMFCRTILAFDHAFQQIHIMRVVLPEEAEGDSDRLRELYESAVAETAALERCLLGTAAMPGGNGRTEPGGSVDSDWDRADFERAVTQAQELIAAGECYQVVLSQRFRRRTSADALAIYRALRISNPSPYMFLLRLGDESLIGASPEMLVRCRGRELEYRPIAGTRPRGASPQDDARLTGELLADEKERAEHVMLVDLGRNDLGRVAAFGSVKVERFMSVEKYSHVQHIVSSLRACLADGHDRFDALAACFPAGTVTGAPKIRAMQAIRDLERGPRGPYAGAVLYLDYAGNLDSCIAIRTIVLRDGEAVVQAGAGIVADSVPAREYEETVNKAQALLRAIEMAEHGL